jgi:3-dehydroquinate synthase
MNNSKYRQKIIFSTDPGEDLRSVFSEYQADKIYLATETQVFDLWIRHNAWFQDFPCIILPAGEDNKTLASVALVWEFLSRSNADRRSLLINVGGGMLTDLGGFAASTFKRGIGFINIPTTLLSQVDASIGGKTGFNLNGLKNEIGTFREPEAVLIYTPFLQTLDRYHFLSGFAEMIKHGLIHNPEHLRDLMSFRIGEPDENRLRSLIRDSVEVKKYFVVNDPVERNIRKALNFGHTIGHAIESLALEQGRQVLHGYAVVWGLMAELWLSVRECGFDEKEALRLCEWMSGLYGRFTFRHGDRERLMALMHHDKKNEKNRINFTLLPKTGSFEINRNVSDVQIAESLDFLQNF